MRDIDRRSVPVLSTEQMREVDRVMVEELGIELVQMMEHAGRHLARLVAREHGPARTRVAVLAGPGGNGGGALVAARRLHAWGAQVDLYLSTDQERLADVTARHLTTLHRMGIGPAGSNPRGDPDVILDGLVGYSLVGPLRGRAAELAEWANGSTAVTVSLDTPSGIDATTGAAEGVAVRADATLTLALPKAGLLAGAAADFVGELYLADIGVPPRVYAALGISVGPIFAQGEIVRLV